MKKLRSAPLTCRPHDGDPADNSILVMWFNTSISYVLDRLQWGENIQHSKQHRILLRVFRQMEWHHIAMGGSRSSHVADEM